MELIRTLGHRNSRNTDYKVYCIKFTLPIFGNKLNNWMFKHNLSNAKFVKGCNEVRYLRKWYREEMRKKSTRVKKPLTKKQLFDLNVKYSHIKPSTKIYHKEWWDYETYWKNISLTGKLSEDFIDEFKDYLDWDYICDFQILSETFIAKHIRYVNWKSISANQTLSERFLRRFKHKVEWDRILMFNSNCLSKEFIEEMKKEGYIKYDSHNIKF